MANLLEMILKPFFGWDMSALYDSAWNFIDFALYLAFFVAISRFTLAKKFDKVGKPLSIIVGISLAIGMSIFSRMYEFRIGSLAPMAGIIFLALLGIVFFKFIRDLGSKTPGAGAFAFLLIFFSITAIVPGFYAWIIEKIPFMEALLSIATIIAVVIVIKEIIKLIIPSGESPFPGMKDSAKYLADKAKEKEDQRKIIEDVKRKREQARRDREEAERRRAEARARGDREAEAQAAQQVGQAQRAEAEAAQEQEQGEQAQAEATQQQAQAERTQAETEQTTGDQAETEQRAEEAEREVKEINKQEIEDIKSLRKDFVKIKKIIKEAKKEYDDAVEDNDKEAVRKKFKTNFLEALHLSVDKMNLLQKLEKREDANFDFLSKLYKDLNIEFSEKGLAQREMEKDLMRGMVDIFKTTLDLLKVQTASFDEIESVVDKFKDVTLRLIRLNKEEFSTKLSKE